VKRGEPVVFYLPLHSGKVVELCDDDDDLADPQFHWYVHSDNFVCCVIGRAPHKKMLVLHRIIYERTPGHTRLLQRQQVEHIDKNPFNCQRKNLRLRRKHFKKPPGSLFRNNTSGYPGVSRYGCQFRAFIRDIRERGGKNIYLGTYPLGEMAAAAYQEAKERKARGEKIRDR